MRVLIPYDGTKNAENAFLELRNPEFAKGDEILVVITDVFMAESLEELSITRRRRRLDFESTGTSSYSPARREDEEERFLALEIRDRLFLKHPSLNIRVESLPGFSLVANELLEKAARWKPDLIILGSATARANYEVDGYKPGTLRIAAEVQCPVRFVFGTVGQKTSKVKLGGQEFPEKEVMFSKLDAVGKFKVTRPKFTNAAPTR